MLVLYICITAATEMNGKGTLRDHRTAKS